MAKTRPSHMFSAPTGIIHRIREGHEQILETFHAYRISSPDSRQALVAQILRQLASQLEMEEHLAFHQLRKSGSADIKLREAIAEYEASMNPIRAAAALRSRIQGSNVTLWQAHLPLCAWLPKDQWQWLAFYFWLACHSFRSSNSLFSVYASHFSPIFLHLFHSVASIHPFSSDGTPSASTCNILGFLACRVRLASRALRHRRAPAHDEADRRDDHKYDKQYIGDFRRRSRYS
jgi:hypothetical protein